ncbi:MAG: TPM domain-containing protein [Methylobacter sp.]
MAANMASRVCYGLGLWLLLFSLMAWAGVGVPKLEQRVTDLTSTLSAEQVGALDAKLAAFEAQKGSQIAVLMVPTTQPKDIAEFGIELADLWQIGRKDVDDGVILIVAKDDRALRLEVGYGLEGVIPDAVAKRIIAEIITPYFKAGDYAGGIDAGITQLIKLIEGEPLPTPSASINSQQDEGALGFVLFGGIIAGWLLSAITGRTTAGIVGGLTSGLLAMLFFGLAVSLALFIGFMVFLIVGFGKTSGRGGWSSGGGFGGGSGGGSWSGGGGRFGGGGASGSW